MRPIGLNQAMEKVKAVDVNSSNDLVIAQAIPLDQPIALMLAYYQ